MIVERVKMLFLLFLSEFVSKGLETCKTDACKDKVPHIPSSHKCKDYTCPKGFLGKKANRDDATCTNAATCDFNCCEVDINSDKKRRNSILTLSTIMVLQNVSKIAADLSQRNFTQKLVKQLHYFNNNQKLQLSSTLLILVCNPKTVV
jgi:hypothetical protein